MTAVSGAASTPLPTRWVIGGVVLRRRGAPAAQALRFPLVRRGRGVRGWCPWSARPLDKPHSGVAPHAPPAWFPTNVARNSHVNLSNLEIALLELQRLWGVLKTDRRELRARVMGGLGLA